MKHLIIGGGNLGMDVAFEARRRGHETILLTRSGGFEAEDPLALVEAVSRADYDVLWYCIGGASVPKEPGGKLRSALINATIPAIITRVAPAGSRVVFFSSDACADESAPDRPQRSDATPLGLFARIKLSAEHQIVASGRPFTTIVRVGSLYGTHKPADTFPGRLLATFGFDRDSSVALPSNLVTPTPTLWVAAVVLDHLISQFARPRLRRLAAVGSHALPSVEVLHCAPRGNVSVRDWAILTLQGLREAHAFAPRIFYDPERPAFSALGCSIATAPHWHALWRVYFRQAWFTPIELRPLLPDEQTVPPEDGETPAS